MKTLFQFVAILLAVFPRLSAQAAPSATKGGATLHYTFRYSQTAEFGGDRGDWQTIVPSAGLDYSNGNDKHLFSLHYTAGYIANVEGPSYSTGMFQHLLLSQGIVWSKWNLLVGDDVSYLPEAPTTGFSGIPGIGEPIGVSNPPLPSSQSILTVNTHVVENNVHGELTHILNFATTLSLGASSGLLRYPGGGALNTNSDMTNGGLTFRINARNSLSAQYLFSQFSYPDYSFTFTTNSGMFGFKRTWTRALSSTVSAGPGWIGSSDNSPIPSSTAISAHAAVNYQFRSGSAGLSYNRSISGGSGYLFGGENDSVVATLSREFGRKLTVGLVGGYLRTTGLRNDTAIEGEYGGIQASRQLGRFLSVFANYTATTQSHTGSLPTNVLNQLFQVASFGMAYSRNTIHGR